jgi:succinate dehydrogenase / fumarate reductase flavoprotein subunit
VFLDIASRLTPQEIQKRLPSMYHQFKELADVDITKEPMEVGPTCHYVMGGVEVDPDSAMSKVPGLFAAGEVAGGMHGSNRLGGNSLSDLLVFGRRAGAGAAEYVDGLAGVRPAVAVADVDAAVDRALLPFSSSTDGGENPFVVQLELQKTMNDLVGIIRKADEMELALKALQDIAVRTRTVSVLGGRTSTPAGTSRWTCATCCSCRCAWPGPRWSARRAAAATPATTTRRWTPTGATCCWCCGRWARTTSSWCARSRCRCGPTCSTCSSSTS